MTSGYDKLAELREKASPGPWQALTFYLVSGQTQIAEFRHSTSVGPSEQDEVLNANNAQLAAISPILAEVIGELRAALEDAPCFHWGQMHQLTTQHGRKRCSEDIAWADGSRHPCKEPCQRCQALTNTDKKLQEALDG